MKIYNKCSYMFWFNQTIIREPTVYASLKLQYWCQLKYFVTELFGRVKSKGKGHPCTGTEALYRY
jgi:hypothetical protein